MNLVFCLVNRLVETARLEVTDTCTGIAVREMAPNIIWAEHTAHIDLHTADAAQQRFAVVVKAYVASACSMRTMRSIQAAKDWFARVRDDDRHFAVLYVNCHLKICRRYADN